MTEALGPWAFSGLVLKYLGLVWIFGQTMVFGLPYCSGNPRTPVEKHFNIPGKWTRQIVTLMLQAHLKIVGLSWVSMTACISGTAAFEMWACKMLGSLRCN